MAHCRTRRVEHHPTTGRSPCTHTSGLTLVETLLAVAITMLVLGLIYSIYNTTFRVVSDQQSRIQGPMAAMQALEEVSQSLACSLNTADSEQGESFELRQEKDLSRLSFLTAVPREGDSLQWYDIQRVSIRVATEGSEQGSLLQESQHIVGPGAEADPTTNVLARGVASFKVLLLEGEQWVEEWPAPQGPDWPKAARLTLELDHGKNQRAFETEVFIPAGNVITSRIETVTSE